MARGGLVAVGLLVPLVILELLLRTLLPGSVDVMNNARFTRVSHRPGQTTELIPGALNPHFVGGPVRVNRHGFRGAELVEPKPSGGFRLLAVGDSVTFGFGVREDQTFHALTAASRAAAGRPLEVVNTGLPGAGLPYYLHTIRTHCAPLEADAVVLSVVLNDIVAYRPEELLDAPMPGSRHKADPAAWSTYLKWSYVGTLGFQRLKSVLYTLGVLDLEDSPGYRFVPLEDDAAEAERAWTASLSVLDRAVEAARACGAPMVVTVFPLEVQLSEEALRRYREGIGVALSASATDLGPQRVLRDWADARGVPFVDLTPAFQKDDPSALFLRDAFVSLDPVHPSALGHSRAATLLEARLVELGLLP